MDVFGYLLVSLVLAAGETSGERVSLTGVEGSRVRVSLGGHALDLDLREHISGCTGTLSDWTVGWSAPAKVDFRLVGEWLGAAGTNVILVSAEATANCAVQSQCGAGSDLTLIALVLERQMVARVPASYVIEDCRMPRFLAEASADRGPEDILVLQEGVLRAVVEEFAPGPTDGVAEICRRQVTFDMREPERGFLEGPCVPESDP